LYNGGTGAEYNSYTLTSADLVGTDGINDYYVWNVVLQNGNDGIAISCLDGSQIEFITYEGAFAAIDGPFVGVTGVDIGVAEDAATTDMQSLQFDGTMWNFNCTATPGAANDLSTCNLMDCPGLGNIGDFCDDLDPTTENDTVDVNCMCVGEPVVFDCPTQMANFGDPCNDMNGETINDVIQSDCSCAGIPAPSSDLYISEISYNPCTDQGADGQCEYVIITNGGATTADLSGYNFSSAFTYTIPDGTMLMAGESLSIGISGNCTAFTFDLSGSWTGSLGNGGEIVELNDSMDVLVTAISYDGTIADGDCDAQCFDAVGVTSSCSPSIATVGTDCQLNIPMPFAGWHIISSYCHPDQDSITQVFAPIVSDIIQVKNLTGQVYVPSFNNFNTLTTWDITQGYLVKTFSPVTLPIIDGTEVDLNVDDIPLFSGWNMIAYWLQGDSDPIDVFDAIATDVIQVKNLNGAYVPSFNNFNNMGNMMTTRGYQVKMIQDNILQYDAANIIPRPAPGITEETKVVEPVHFTREINPNPNSATILVMDDENNNLNYGDEFGIFTQDGILVGSFVYEYDMMGGLAFGHDETEESKSGLSANETYVFKVWDSILDEEREVEMNFIQGSSNYQKDDLCAISFKADGTTGINDLDNALSVRVTPNPASNEVNFTLRLEESSDVSIEVYQMDGSLVDVVTNERLATGLQTVKYNVEHLSNGMYLYQVTSAGESFRERFVIAR